MSDLQRNYDKDIDLHHLHRDYHHHHQLIQINDLTTRSNLEIPYKCRKTSGGDELQQFSDDVDLRQTFSSRAGIGALDALEEFEEQATVSGEEGSKHEGLDCHQLDEDVQ